MNIQHSSVTNKDGASKRLRGETVNTTVLKLDWTGRKHTEETKRKIGEKNSINQKGENNNQFGTCWITNGKENKKIKKENIIPDGWKLGRKIK